MSICFATLEYQIFIEQTKSAEVPCVPKRSRVHGTYSSLSDVVGRVWTIGMRILVMLLLDTLPMLGNVLLLCFFVFFIFGIIGVQLWAGLLRNRCFLDLPDNVSTSGSDHSTNQSIVATIKELINVMKCSANANQFSNVPIVRILRIRGAGHGS
jgi:hypothetical protein